MVLLWVHYNWIQHGKSVTGMAHWLRYTNMVVLHLIHRAVVIDFNVNVSQPLSLYCVFPETPQVMRACSAARLARWLGQECQTESGFVRTSIFSNSRPCTFSCTFENMIHELENIQKSNSAAQATTSFCIYDELFGIPLPSYQTVVWTCAKVGAVE